MSIQDAKPLILLYNPKVALPGYQRVPHSLLQLGTLLEERYPYAIIDGNLDQERDRAAEIIEQVRREPWRRRAVLLLLLTIALGVLLPLLNAYTAPRNQVIQQGRYLFPALTPVALLLALGWRTLLPPRLRSAGLALGLLFGLSFAAAALSTIVGFYGPR